MEIYELERSVENFKFENDIIFEVSREEREGLKATTSNLRTANVITN